MDRGVAVALTAVVGGMVALKAPINSGLGKTVGNFQAAFVSFAVGTIILAVIAGLARGGFGQIAEARTLAPQYLLGGVLGACYVSVIIDQFGLLGLDKDPISAMKAIGVLLLAAGTLLVVRG